MATVALFHSALGVSPGVKDAELRLSQAGYDVHVIDCYGGRTFDDYDEAERFIESEIGYDGLFRMALQGVADLPAGILYAGFSNGAGQAEYCAAVRPGAMGVLLLSGALSLDMVGIRDWPAVPVQMHIGRKDSFRDDGWIRDLESAVRRSGASFELVEYDTAGHLFADISRVDEYDGSSAEQLWPRAVSFLDSCVRAAQRAEMR